MDSIQEAERAVLVALFRQHPDHYLWTGGSVLQLLEHSPRASADIDLIPTEPIDADTLRATVDAALAELEPLLGQRWETGPPEQREGFLRLRINDSAGRTVFTVDVTSIAGFPTGTRSLLFNSLLAATTVRVPDASALLASKWRALLLRGFPKAGDLFDVWFLLDRQVRLEDHHRLALLDDLSAAEVDIDARLDSFHRIDWRVALERSGVSLPVDAARVIFTTVKNAARELAS